MSDSLERAERATDLGVLKMLARRDEGWAQALQDFGCLRGVVMASDEALSQYVSPRALRALRASFEIARRFAVVADSRPRFETPADTAGYLRCSLGHLQTERFVALFFGPGLRLLRCVTIAEGSVDQCVVDVRRLFSEALTHRASAMVLSHNHPSGDPEPSHQDVTLTRNIIAASKTLHVQVLDHIIIGAGDSYVSFCARGLLV